MQSLLSGYGSDQDNSEPTRDGQSSPDAAAQRINSSKRSSPSPSPPAPHAPSQDAPEAGLSYLPPQTSTEPIHGTQWPLAKFGISAPSPNLKPDPALQNKLANYHNLLTRGISFNKTLEQNKAFRNPHILDTLISHVDIDETWSNFDDSFLQRADMFSLGSAKVIAQRQTELNEERERRQERGKRDKIGFDKPSASGTKRRERSHSPVRRHKR